MGLILGLDQGSSKTIAALADPAGNVLGIGCAGGACHSCTGMESAMRAVSDACSLALAQAGVDLRDVDILVAGMTGADWPEEYFLLHEALQKTVHARSIRVLNDCIIAMRGGTDLSHGAVLCAGSGLNCAVKSPDGREFIYGYYIDEADGGTGALGRKVISSVILAQTGVLEPTSLAPMVLGHFQLSDVDRLANDYLNRRLLGDWNGLVPLLFAAADGGDSVAAKILEDFGRSISRYVIAGFNRFGILDIETDVVLSGGIFKGNCPILRRSVEESIREHAPRARVVDALYEPVVGALLLGFDSLYGEKPSDGLRQKLRKSSEHFGLMRTGGN